MGQQIIRQPNGKFATFSTNSDSFSAIDMTAAEIIHQFTKRERAVLKERSRQLRADLKRIKKGEKLYHQFTLSWDRAVAKHRENLAEDEKDNRFEKRIDRISAAASRQNLSTGNS